MAEQIPTSRQALQEAFTLSAEILRNLELSELSLASISLKAARLARLLNDVEMQKVFAHECSGYPSMPDVLPPELFELAVRARREFKRKDSNSNEIKSYVYTESISYLEEKIRFCEVALQSASDRDVSISSANPRQYVYPTSGNWAERKRISEEVARAVRRISERRTLIYDYVLKRHYELKFSGIADDLFSRVRDRVDAQIGQHIPDAAQKLSAVYENLQSDNPEDWSNAVHSCRRVLQDLADALFPPTEDRTIIQGDKERRIKLGKDNYINRLIAFIEGNSDSSRFKQIVGSQLAFIGDRLDSVFSASQKGSHSTIVDREEADRYVVYTYLIVGDLLSITLKKG